MTVVVVTYGDRLHLVEKVLTALDRSARAVRVVLVINGPVPYDLDSLSRSDRSFDLDLVKLDENAGSAGGFAIGLKRARMSTASSDLILMLDDDNCPAAGAVAALCDAATFLSVGNGLLMNRISRPEISRAVAQGRSIREARDSFAAFSFSEAFKKRLNLGFLRCSLRGGDDDRRILTTEFAPYGGLAVLAGTLDLIGFPRTDYFLYSDDHEYSFRIAANGGSIRIVAEAVLHDLEDSWHLNARTLLPWFDPLTPDLRVYFTIRNRVDFESTVLSARSSVRVFNAMIFVVLSAFGTISLTVRGESLSRITRRQALVWTAVRNGLQGNLGSRLNFPDSLRTARAVGTSES